jgi:DNA-binding transcriptional MerR regulator/effector-binding domain-containing protein
MYKDKLLSISEFASLSGIKRANLIYYDEIDVLKPIYRGENNYRMYSYMQLDLAYVITSLRNMGVSLNEIKEYVQNRTPKKASNLLEKQIKVIDEEIDKLHQIKYIMKKYVENIKLYANIKTPKIQLIKKGPEIICLAPPIYETNEKMESIVDFIQLCRKNGINFVNHTGKIFFKQTMDEKKLISPDQFYIKSYKGSYEIEEGLYLVLYDRSDGTNNSLLYKKIFKYINEYNLDICGNTYEEYPLDEISINNPKDYLIKISVRVKYK